MRTKMQSTVIRSAVVSQAVVLAMGTHGIGAAVNWDGGTDPSVTPDASGSWATATNWVGDAVPSGAAADVVLENVTTGTRVVTYDVVNPSVNTLTMNQTTVGAINQLNISNTLTLGTNGAQTLLTTTLGPGVAVGGVVINLETGGLITTTATGAKTYSNAGTINFNGGSISLSIGNNAQANRTFTNTGIVNATASGGFTYTNTQTGNNQATGLFTNDVGAQLNVTGGTFTFGNTNTATNQRSGSVRLNNGGSTSVGPGATLVIKNNGGNQSSDTSRNEFNNLAGATFTLGSASNGAGIGTLFLRTTGAGSSPFANKFDNSGTATLYGRSVINNAIPASLSTAFAFNNNSGATLHLNPDSTGIVIGSDPSVSGDIRHALVVTNAGTINIAPFDPLSTGLVQFGQVASAGRNAVQFDNTGSGIVNIGVNATARVLSRLPGSVTQANAVSNANGATINLGSSSLPLQGGTLQQSIAGVSTGATTASAPTFSNSGLINAYGTSVLELNASSLNTAAVNTYTFTNTSTGSLNLYDTSRIGNAAKSTIFSNTGTLTKLNAGTATIASAAGGTNSNSGNITVNAGTLAFSQALTSTAGTIDIANGASLSTGGLAVSGGVLKGKGTVAGNVALSGTASLEPGSSPGVLSFDNDLSLGGTANFEINGLVRGTSYDGVNVGGQLNYGGTLALSFGTVSSTTTYDLFAFTGPDAGTFGSISIGGAYATFTLNTLDNETWTGTSGSTSFTFTESTGDLVVAVPEPTSLALLALGGLMIGRRRRAG